MTRVIVDADALNALMAAATDNPRVASFVRPVRASIRKAPDEQPIIFEDAPEALADDPPFPAVWDNDDSSK